MPENQKELLANIAPFGLRMQAELKERIKAAAEKNNRSMNAEIVGRLEAYDMLQWRMGELMEERERLSVQLEAVKVALIEQKATSAQLQKLIHMNSEEAQRDQQTADIIDKKYKELKDQSDYLESLKAELLELSKERDEIKSEAEELVKRQGEALQRLTKSQLELSKSLQKIFISAAEGDDAGLKKIVAAFRERGE